MNIDKDFIEVCSQWSNQQYSSIGSDNGFVPTRQQAIIWTNDGLKDPDYNMMPPFFPQQPIFCSWKAI